MRLGISLAVVLTAGSCAGTVEDRGGRLQADASPDLTIERMLAQPSLTGTAPSAPAWSPDGRRLAFLWKDGGGPGREIWLVEADGTNLRQLSVPSGEEGSVSGMAWLPDADALVYLREDALWRVDLAGKASRLTSPAGRVSSLRVSPNGRYASFLRAGDLWLYELDAGSLTQATDVGVPTIATTALGRYSLPEVEIGPYIWGGPSYAWAPDSQSIAVHHVDRRGVRTVPFPDYLDGETAPNLVRRSYPGDPNEARNLGIVTLASGELRLLDLPDPEANRIVGFSWSPEGRLLLDRESDTAVDRWVDIVDVSTGALEEVWHHRRESRVYTQAGSVWHPDGERVVILSDLEDRYGLYVVGGGLAQPRRITGAGFDVTAPPQVLRKDGVVVFQANEPSPYERHIYCVPADGGEAARLTSLPGQNRAFPSPDGRCVAVLHSSDDRPTELYLVPRGGAADPVPQEQRRITSSVPPEFEEREWARVRYETFASRSDGSVLHARIMEPPRLDPQRRYPVLFGPVYSNTVRNRWGGRYGLIQQLLVDRGYIVVQVDVRGSTGYGRAFREGFLMDFAGQDLEDLESVVLEMRTWPQVDPKRFGIWGSSYGGTLTIYALLKKPGLFQAGVAGAAAVDPHFFGGDDVAIVRRPGSHPEAFQRGALQYAANLSDPLLIIHGMQDQVVPFKTTVALAEELMRQGKDFDFAFAPAGTHGWTGPPHYARYLIGKLVAHFDRHLAESTETEHFPPAYGIRGH